MSIPFGRLVASLAREAGCVAVVTTGAVESGALVPVPDVVADDKAVGAGDAVRVAVAVAVVVALGSGLAVAVSDAVRLGASGIVAASTSVAGGRGVGVGVAGTAQAVKHS